MAEPRTAPDHEPAYYEEEEAWDGAGEDEELPARPRRRLVTPVTLGLTAVVIAAGGFIGGVEVQKHQGGSSSTGGAASGLPAGFAARLGGGGARGGTTAQGGAATGAAGDFTTGSVANKHGSTLYVTDSSGDTIRVKTNSSSKVTRTAAASANGVYPGDTVIVTGTKHSDGTITASSIRATSKTAASSGGGGFFGGGFPGGAPPGGGTTTQGGGTSTGGG
jgi:hypothetical protein